MEFDTPQSWAPDLESAIDRHPLTVLPTTPLNQAIALLCQTRTRTSLDHEVASVELHAHTSCLLVVQDGDLIGIVTERDVVRLTAVAYDFDHALVADVMISPVVTLPAKSVGDIFAAIFLFRRYRIRHLPIVDDLGKLIGVISNESIRQILRPANLLRFRRVADVMTTDVIQANLTTSILELAKLMSTNRVSCVVITQPDHQGNLAPVGIVTERDIIQFRGVQIDLVNTQAQTVMSTPLFLLNPEDSLWAAHQEMQQRRVGRLVVSWNWGQGLGIVTQSSLLKAFDPIEMYGVIENLQQTIKQLELERDNRSTEIAAPSLTSVATASETYRQIELDI
jgi:CBS domain-containing protein